MNHLNPFLTPTFYIDSDSPSVIGYMQSICKNESDPTQKAIHLFYAVRDDILYTPYNIRLTPEALKASSVLEARQGFCISKAVLLAAVARAAGIPSRLGFADVKNHLTTKRLYALMQTDVFIYHGYTELYLNNKWLKATPAFNRSLCKRFGVHPLEFDGQSDALLQEFDQKGNRHMEYLVDRGTHPDLPFEDMVDVLKQNYPKLFHENLISVEGDLEKEE